MRGLIVAVVAGAVVVLVAAALYLRSGNTSGETAVGAGAVGGGAKMQPLASSQGGSQGASNEASKEGGAGRSSRVEERLGQLRDDFERRQVGGGNPAPNKRAVPTMSASNRKAMEDGDDEEGDDDEDPKEMAELKHTLMTDPDPDERIGAVLMLTGEEGPESLNMLLEAMGDPDPEVRLAVVEALGDRAEELSPDTLTPALRDSDPEVRFEAVSILGDMETPEALAIVRGMRTDPDDDVRALVEGIDDMADEDEPKPGQANQPQGQPAQPQHAQPKSNM
jgi:hypothetical protein